MAAPAAHTSTIHSAMFSLSPVLGFVAVDFSIVNCALPALVVLPSANYTVSVCLPFGSVLKNSLYSVTITLPLFMLPAFPV